MLNVILGSRITVKIMALEKYSRSSRLVERVTAGLDFGDCLAVACAQHSGCAQMLSLHLPHGAEFGGVTVVHPLQQAAPAVEGA